MPSNPLDSLRRPVGTGGPARNPDLDTRILDAALRLLVDDGYGGMTMDKVAAEAMVGKPTVYRRWQSRAHLAAEAFVHGGVVNSKRIVTLGAGQLRAELVETIIGTAECAAGPADALLAAMKELGRRHPAIGDAIEDRYTASIREAIVAVLTEAGLRGDRVPSLGKRLDTRIDATIALLATRRSRDDRDISREDVADVVDHLILDL